MGRNITLYPIRMPSSVLTENAFQTLAWDEKLQLLHICFHPTSLYTPLAQLRKEAGRTLRSLETLKPKAILVDARALALTLGHEEQTELLRVASEARTKFSARLAILEPKDIFVQVSLHQFLTSLGLTSQDFDFFHGEKEAVTWLTKS